MSEIAKKHPYLYHYTTLEGLKGILETQTLWATHFEFLNDSSELSTFKDILSNALMVAHESNFDCS